MHFQHRSTKSEDFPACFELLYDRFLYDAAERQRLLSLWREVLESEQASSAVVEGIAPNGSRQIVGFGINIFVADSFADDVLAGTQPFIARQVLMRHLAGRSPILNRKAIREGNAGPGLRMMGLSVGHVQAADVSPAIFHGVMGQMLASTEAAHRGYHIRESISEGYGAAQRDLLLAAGLQLRTDYEDFFRGSGSAPTRDHWPYLLGLTREEAVANPFGALACWFRYNRPQWGLKPAQQRLLALALAGETDEELARSLSISPWTIKKRWKSIYEDVQAAKPDLLAAEGEDFEKSRSSRGAERRRHLLNYLRAHMEELRPH